jgi:hypothetical protein
MKRSPTTNTWDDQLRKTFVKSITFYTDIGINDYVTGYRWCRSCKMLRECVPRTDDRDHATCNDCWYNKMFRKYTTS